MAITKTFTVTNVDRYPLDDRIEMAAWSWSAEDSSTGYVATINGSTNILSQGIAYSTATESIAAAAIQAAIGSKKMTALEDSLDAKVLLAPSTQSDLAWENPTVTSFDPSLYYTKSQVDSKDATRLPLAGGTMAGDIDMGGNTITNLPVPTALTDAATKDYVDDAIAGIAPSASLPLAGGTMAGDIDMGANQIVGLAAPAIDTDAANKKYVDDAIVASAIDAYTKTEVDTLLAAIPTSDTDPGFQNRILFIEPAAGSNSTSLPLLANALALVTGSSWTINIGAGQYNAPAAVSVSGKNQLQIIAPEAAGTTCVTHVGDFAITNSTGVRVTNFQIQGNTSLDLKAGLGIYLSKCQLQGNLTIGGTGGFAIISDTDISGNITISPTFAGVVYFVRTAWSGSAGVYTMSQASALQVIIMDGTGIPAGRKATYSGSITDKSNIQRQYIGGLPVVTTGATDGAVLKFVAGTTNQFQPAVLNSDASKLSINGSIPMQGDLDMGTNQISNMGDPAFPQDAATKAYVDAAVAAGGGGGGATSHDYDLIGSVTTATGSIDLTTTGHTSVEDLISKHKSMHVVVHLSGGFVLSTDVPMVFLDALSYPITIPVLENNVSPAQAVMSAGSDTTITLNVSGGNVQGVKLFVRK